MSITITIKYDCGYKGVVTFLRIMDAVRYGENKAANPPDKAVSIVLTGPDGEREFIKQ